MKTNKTILIFTVALIVVAAAYSANALVLNNHRPSVTPAVANNWTAGSSYTPLSGSSYHTGTLFTSHSYWNDQKGGSEFSGFYQNSRTSNWRYDNNECELETTATPEPASLILFATGLVGAGVYRRMKK